MSDTPPRKQSELTVPLDRDIISQAAKAAIAAAIESYPDASILDDQEARRQLMDRPTMVRCPEMCQPCRCCAGAGMVSVAEAAEWEQRRADSVVTGELDEPA